MHLCNTCRHAVGQCAEGVPASSVLRIGYGIAWCLLHSKGHADRCQRSPVPGNLIPTSRGTTSAQLIAMHLEAEAAQP